MLYGLIQVNDLLGYGYLGIIVFLILTGCGLPIPEEAAIIAAGALSAPPNPQLDWRLALLSCIVGAVVGDSVMYWIGRHFGAAMLHKHPLWLRMVTPEREAMDRRAVEKTWRQGDFGDPLHGRASLADLPDGRAAQGALWPISVDRHDLRLFVVTLFFGLTYFYGGPILAWLKDAERGLTVAVVAVVCVAVYWYRRHTG